MRRVLLIGLIILVFGVISILLLASFAPKEVGSQMFFVGGGLLLFALAQLPFPKMYRQMTPFLGGGTFFLLLVTLFLGKISHGAMRWLPVGPFHIQISEFAKPIFSLVLAWYITRFPLHSQRHIGGFFLVCAGFFLPVFLQPDLGSALVLTAIAATLLLLCVKRFRLLVPWIIAFFILIVLSWNTVLYQYQKDRLLSFLSNTGSASYNAEQAYITVGSGKLLGRGLGHGVQSQLKFLPEYHTDFFFASFAEELGLVGVIIFFCLYLSLLLLLLRMPKTTVFATLVTWGFVGALFFQMVVHIGMNVKLLPITGIPLPFLSSGGSSFIATCLGIGVLVRLSTQKEGSSLVRKPLIWYTNRSIDGSQLSRG